MLISHVSLEQEQEMLSLRYAPEAGGLGPVPEHMAQVRPGARIHHLHARHEGDATVRDLHHVLRVHGRVETGPPCSSQGK